MSTAACRLYDDALWDEVDHYQRHDMLVEIDFKWLMAGLGHHVDPIRLRNDASYARDRLQWALASNCDPLRVCAACLRSELEHHQGAVPQRPPASPAV